MIATFIHMKFLPVAIRHRLGLIRSLAIYYWQPGKLRQLRAFYQQLLPDQPLCFDIGAHLGNRSFVWRQLGARVVAVEPQSICLKYLRKRFASDPQVTILPVAVAAEPGEMQLHVSALTPTITSLAGQDWQKDIQALSSFHVKWDYTQTVQTVVLEELVQTYGVPDFCKIDVEDFELEVLRGLQTPIPLLSFEYLSARIQKTIACINRLETIGTYEYNWSLGESHHMETESWVPAPAIRRILKSFTRENPSGDVYARRSNPSNASFS